MVADTEHSIPAPVASALKLAGPSPHPRIRPARSVADNPNMRRYSSKDRPQGMTSLSFMSNRSPETYCVGMGGYALTVQYLA